MPRFYFDHREGEELIRDDEGLECATVDEARDEATAALAERAKDALPGAIRRELAIEVSGEGRRPLFRASLRFEVQSLSPDDPGPARSSASLRSLR